MSTTEWWFDYYTGEEQTTLGGITVSAPFAFIQLYLHGETIIIPHQQSAMNTVASSKKPLYLIIIMDEKQSAHGDLFGNDGESIDTYERLGYNYFILITI